MKFKGRAGRSATDTLLLTAHFYSGDSENAVPFLLQRNPTRGYHYAVRNTAGIMKGAESMKKIKSYTGIWNVEKVLYAINDFNLPFPVTFTQIAWFVMTEFIIILFGDLPPLSMIEGAFLKYFGIPVALTWFMSQKTFDGKKPYSFLKSQIAYALRPKITYAGKAVKLQKEVLNETITAVRSVNHVPD